MKMGHIIDHWKSSSYSDIGKSMAKSQEEKRQRPTATELNFVTQTFLKFFYICLLTIPAASRARRRLSINLFAQGRTAVAPAAHSINHTSSPAVICEADCDFSAWGWSISHILVSRFASSSSQALSYRLDLQLAEPASITFNMRPLSAATYNLFRPLHDSQYSCVIRTYKMPSGIHFKVCAY